MDTLLNESINSFIQSVKRYYLSNKLNSDKSNGYTLLSGSLFEYGPTYALRVGSISNTISEITNTIPLVVFDNSNTEINKINISSAFNVNNYIGMNNEIKPKINSFCIKILTNLYFYFSKFLLLTKQYKIFRLLSYSNIVFGDLIYDEYIKNNPYKNYTLIRFEKKDKSYFKNTFYNIFSYKYIMKHYKIKYFVTTHSQYIWGGIPTRYFYKKNAIVFETTDDMLFIYDKYYNNIPKYHNYINYKISKSNNIVNSQDLLKTLDNLKFRFSGKLEQIDVKLAYGDKKIYSIEDFKNELNINNDFPIVFILAHIFSDAPCGLSDFQVFPDYYSWLKQTIEIIKNIQNVNWIVKEHPSVNAYNEQGIVQKLIDNTNSKNVNLCPSDFSTASLINIANLIITAQGTAGIEYSCMGIPVIITSKAFYSGNNFTIEPKTVSKYKKLLKNICLIKPLNEKQKNDALRIYNIFNRLQNKDFLLIDTTIKNMIWGSSVPQDTPGAFNLMADRLKEINPNEMYFIKQVKDYFKENNL